MSSSKIKLQTTSILNIPLQSYAKDFTFIVNGKEFNTSIVISDLLSPKISQFHQSDPTFNVFTINTKERGDFSKILKLVNFESNDISENELAFILEIIEILGNDSICIDEPKENITITSDNVFNLLEKHAKHKKIYRQLFEREIQYITTHFFELCEKKIDEFEKMNINTLIDILNNQNLQLTAEDQLLKFINKLYSKSNEYSILYGVVYFENISCDAMKSFLDLYDVNDINRMVWNRISKRLEKELNSIEIKDTKRYKMKQINGKQFLKNPQKEFSGIFNYLQTTTNGQIEKEVNFSSSDNKDCPKNVVLFDDAKSYFNHYSKQDNWICFEFKNHRLIPTDYTIRSIKYNTGWDHPKNWVIEGSLDNKSWEIIDEQTNCSYLNGRSLVHTFSIKNPTNKEFKFIRMRSTGLSWGNDSYLSFEAFEIYGTLI